MVLVNRLSAAQPVPRKKHIGVPGTLLNDSQRIVFVGDSITYSGQFIDDMEMVLRRSAPDSEFEFLDLGLPSETVSGLSEPGHAGGAFPRPNLHDRLTRLLELVHPDLVIACYGMNDGIYYPFDQAKFEAFQRGISLLRERVLRSGAKIIHVTPPVFDPMPIRQSTLPAGRPEYRQPFEGYDTVLEHYSAWLVEQRKKGWKVIDAHTPLKAFIEEQRLLNPGFVLASDGVHMNEQGHWLLAQILLKGIKARTMSERVILDLSTGRAKGPGVRNMRREDGSFSFIWDTRPPIPFLSLLMELEHRDKHHEWLPSSKENEHSLVGRGAKAARYELFESERLLATLSPPQITAGIDTRTLPNLPTTVRGHELLRLIHTRNRLLSDSWLTSIGHKRPGMEHGLPLKEAVAQAELLKRKIEELNQPVEMRFRVEALPK